MEYPGRLYVAATLLPLASFVILLLAGGLRAAVRPRRNTPLGASIYQALGGDTPVRSGAFIATAAIGLAFVCSLIGFVIFLQDPQAGRHGHGGPHAAIRSTAAGHEANDTESEAAHTWSESIVWSGLNFPKQPATRLTLGYHIDSL